MKVYCKTIVLVLVLGLVLLSWSSGARARLLVVSSQSLKHLRSHEKNPSKNVDSSFRRIPPSRSNPTQNK
ncbi:hypothetical protein BVRB_7g169100 [Beta vulgaris subsp. vulgaris]|nr:hypothetical protein BVRB_7g169100 [Beta vulgaris subsp. vulgaris]